jgi:hypothetical protein
MHFARIGKKGKSLELKKIRFLFVKNLLFYRRIQIIIIFLAEGKFVNGKMEIRDKRKIMCWEKLFGIY